MAIRASAWPVVFSFVFLFLSPGKTNACGPFSSAGYRGHAGGFAVCGIKQPALARGLTFQRETTSTAADTYWFLHVPFGNMWLFVRTHKYPKHWSERKRDIMAFRIPTTVSMPNLPDISEICLFLIKYIRTTARCVNWPYYISCYVFNFGLGLLFISCCPISCFSISSNQPPNNIIIYNVFCFQGPSF